VSLSTPDVLVRLVTAADARGRQSAWAALVRARSVASDATTGAAVLIGGNVSFA